MILEPNKREQVIPMPVVLISTVRARKKLTRTIQRMFWEDSIVPFTIKIAPNNVNPFHHLIRYLYSFVI